MPDTHWMEVMQLAKKYGFITSAYGGVAVLATHANQKERYGEEEYRKIQEMNGREVTDRRMKEDGYIETEQKRSSFAG